MNIYEIAKLIPCAVGSLRTYLCRTEFSHVKPERIGRAIHYQITSADIERLRSLFNRRPAHSGDRYAK